MHPMLNIAVRAARRAGSIINRAALAGGLNVRSKRAKDYVTQVDQAAEEAIIDIVRCCSTSHACPRIGWRRCWRRKERSRQPASNDGMTG